MCPIPGNKPIPEKTSQDAPHPRKSRKNITKRRFCLVVGCWLFLVPTSCADAPFGGKNITRYAPSPEIPEKSSQDAPHPRKSRRSRKIPSLTDVLFFLKDHYFLGSVNQKYYIYYALQVAKNYRQQYLYPKE